MDATWLLLLALETTGCRRRSRLIVKPSDELSGVLAGRPGDRGMDRDDHAVLASAGGRLVVVLRDEHCDGLRQVLGECRAVSGVGEANLAVHAVRRYPLSRLRGAGDQLADVLDQLPGECEQPP